MFEINNRNSLLGALAVCPKIILNGSTCKLSDILGLAQMSDDSTAIIMKSEYLAETYPGIAALFEAQIDVFSVGLIANGLLTITTRKNGYWYSIEDDLDVRHSKHNYYCEINDNPLTVVRVFQL